MTQKMLIHYFLSLITLWVRLENIWEVALVMAWHHLLHLSKWVSQPWETETQALLSINRPLKGGKRRKVHKMTVRKKSSNEIVVNFHIISRNSKYLFNFVEVTHTLEKKEVTSKKHQNRVFEFRFISHAYANMSTTKSQKWLDNV